MFGVFAVEVVIGSGDFLVWGGSFYKNNTMHDEPSIGESCTMEVRQDEKNFIIYGVFIDSECDAEFFDSESSISNVIGKRGKIELIKGMEWTGGSLGVWKADDLSRQVYLTM